MDQKHSFSFARLGGIDQALFRTAEDFAHLPSLDQKLWVALACPVNGIAIDRRTLELIDTDHDGRIRASELLNAIEFVKQRAGAEGIDQESDELHLRAIDTSTEAGARLIQRLERDGKVSIALKEVLDDIARFTSRPLNGDGVVTTEATSDDATKKTIQEIIDLYGAVEDRSGKPGVDQAKLDAFFGDVEALAKWDAAGSAKELRPFGDRTEAAHRAFVAVRAKIEDYFARTRLAEFDPRSVDPLNRNADDLAAIGAKDLSANRDAVAALPLARVTPKAALPLRRGVNPAWEQEMNAFADEVVVPLLGDRAELDQAGWSKIVEALAPFDRWLGSKPTTPAAKLDLARIRELSASKLRAEIFELIELDRSKKDELSELEELERLLRYQRDLKKLVENFVSFSDFYDPSDLASFQAGRLFMDARSAELCIIVDDVAKHATLAASSKMFLAYCELFRKATNERKTICVGFTSGIGQTLFVGRNGIFYDRDGLDWDATIVKIVEGPVSLREAFWAPWRKIAGMAGAQIAKLLESKEQAAQAAASTTIGSATAQVEAGKPPAPAPAAAGGGGAAIASSVAAIGIALGFLSTAVASLLSYITGVPLWKTVLGLGGVVLVVSGPSVAIAYFKLRQRDLAPVLNASGWAINGRILLNRKLGGILTKRAVLPKGSQRRLSDPYAESHTGRNLVIAAVAVAAVIAGLWYAGVLEPLLAQLFDQLMPR